MWTGFWPLGSDILGIPHGDPKRCQAKKKMDLDPEIWGDEVEFHRCVNAPKHTDPHRCRACGHRWEDAA